jgi:hypothetical protein
VSRARARAVATLVFLTVAGTCTTAPARTVSYANIVSPSKLISCFAVMHSSEVECTAPYLPDIGELDTYLGLRARGKAILSERGDFPGFSSPRRTLRYGDTWKRPGIRCTIRTTGLTCRNRDGHGFHIQRDHVRRF